MSAKRTQNTPLPSSLIAHAKKKHIFNGLHSVSIISLCQLCDNDCVAILNKNGIHILKGKTLILKGNIKKTDDLWDIPISRTVRHHAIEIITNDKTKTELMQYINGGCFSPTPRNPLKEIKNENFLTSTCLNNQQLLKHLPTRTATHLGHMDQERKTSNIKACKIRSGN